MDRCALFVDAGYVLADGATAVHGTRRRESVTWDYGGLLQLLASLSMERSRLPLLRCYWYEATAEGHRSADHEALADLPGVKLRVTQMLPGRRPGADIHRDLTTLARNKAISDAMVVTAEDNLTQAISDAQDMGMRVTLLNIAIDGNAMASRTLRQESDDIVEISSAHLRPYVELIAGAEPPRADERDGNIVALRPASNGNGNGKSNGNGNGRGAAGRTGPYPLPTARPAASQQPPAAVYAAPAAPDYAEYSDYQADAGQPERPETAPAASGAPAVAGYPGSDYPGSDYPGGEYHADYGAAHDYGQLPEQGPAVHDPGVSVPEPAPARQDMLPATQERATPDAQPGRLDHGARRGALLVAGPAPAEDVAVERPSARPRQENDLLRQAESGYSPGAPWEPFQTDAVTRDPLAMDRADRYQPAPVPAPVPVPTAANSAQVRRLPTRSPGQPGVPAGQPVPAAGTPSGAQPVVQAAPAEARGMGYGGVRQQSMQGPGVYPAQSNVPLAVPNAPAPLAAPVYSGGQGGVSLGDAVQSAHEEGQAFGDSVARDAPALWLEAVLARKPRMPSDLEARLLQGSALPIDFLLHDEVRHALRRGFWDALERARR